MLKIDLKKKKDITFLFYYKVGKDKGSISFSHFAKLLFCFLHFCILGQKNDFLISCCGNIKKRMMCQAKLDV